ncbi:hypothetical protein LZ554_009389 [Drepanopeziza brunnea f. sp. 'monogermtubi']|nr:hypothetical protein LZ554_009389 [Drepanopeziza brunnea f. sp. 'monogermtubi']
MTSDNHPPGSTQQPLASSPTAPVPQNIPAASPPTKQSLKSWWKGFSKQPPKSQEQNAPLPTGIFGIPLRQSITYANVAISLVDGEGRSYIYGYVPIVVAKCGVYLKEKATNVEGIFRLSGSEKRIKELRTIFDSPDRYGKGLDWAGYTVHDAANVLRRYLNQLPEPIVPLDLYERFREPLRGFTKQAVGDAEGPQLSEDFDAGKAIVTYQQLITELPPLNRQLLLYILDLLAVFASKSDENRMTSANLSAIFQPGMLSHPVHDMEPGQYRLSQDVLIFLIENQDHFLIGMRGTAADEKTVAEVQNGGTPPPGTPSTPGKTRSGVARTASNASAGADSVRKFGGIRRNVSVSSHHSRQSNGAPSPASPAYGPPVTHSPGAGIHRSNTVPSKRSPGLPPNRLNKHSGSPSPTAAAIMSSQHVAPRGLSPVAASSTTRNVSPSASSAAPTAPGVSSLAPSYAAPVASNERLLGDQNVTPPTSRNISNLFQRSPTSATEGEKKQPNKLRKKRAPGSSNPSAHSSTQSLHSQDHSSPAFPPTRIASEVASHPPLESIPSANPILSETQATPPATEPSQADVAGHQLVARHDELHQSSEKTLKPASPSGSLRSRSSYNDQSDPDHQEDTAAVAEQREKRSRWRLSRHHREPSQLGTNLSPKKAAGSENGAGASSSSVGSSSRHRKSISADTHPAGTDSTPVGAQPQSTQEISTFGEEKKGPLGWIKKMRDKLEENKERERNKSPPASIDRTASAISSRGKEAERAFEERTTPPQVSQQPPQQPPPQPPQP